MGVPDGYERFGERSLRLIDPQVCPAGHPFRFGTRQNPARCPEHRQHNTWLCACSQWIWRYDGAFVGERPPCVS